MKQRFQFKRVHLIGIKGQGMTALAEVLLRNGVAVSGSDTDEVFTTDAILKRLGIAVTSGFAPEHLPQKVDLVVYSTAYTAEKNPELRAALDHGLHVLSYPEALGLLSAEALTIAVSGTHGKTTTSALLGSVLRAAGADPTVIVGSQIKAWGGNALVGAGQYFVLEADEYQNKFQHYTPWGMILTSVDWDHPDFFPTPAEYQEAFRNFVAKIPRHGWIVACGDSAAVKAIAETAAGTKIFYGFHSQNDVRIVDQAPIPPDLEAGQRGFFQTFSIAIGEERFGPFSLRLAGVHNAENAAAVFAVAHHLKLPLDRVATALQAFEGTKRRFERIGERRGLLVYDDYAHHPDEVRATLAAFRSLYPNRQLTVIFHPHTYTRTRALLEEFAQCFDAADAVWILDIYGSAREDQGGVSAADVVTRINRYTPNKARHAPDRSALVEEIRNNAKAGDIVVTMGAGDVWHIAESLVKS